MVFRSSVKKSFQPNLNYVVMVTKLMSNGEQIPFPVNRPPCIASIQQLALFLAWKKAITMHQCTSALNENDDKSMRIIIPKKSCCYSDLNSFGQVVISLLGESVSLAAEKKIHIFFFKALFELRTRKLVLNKSRNLFFPKQKKSYCFFNGFSNCIKNGIGTPAVGVMGGKWLNPFRIVNLNFHIIFEQLERRENRKKNLKIP